VKSTGLYLLEFGSSRKVAVASWLFRVDAVACFTALGMCLSSDIRWQMDYPVNCVENASALEPNTLSPGWAVRNS
jgi:hypothetical protein